MFKHEGDCQIVLVLQGVGVIFRTILKIIIYNKTVQVSSMFMELSKTLA